MGLLVGPPKKGKSWLVGNIGLAVARGGLALGAIRVAQRPVLYLALEDGDRRLQSRFRHLLGPGVPIPAGISRITEATPLEAMAVITEFMGRHLDEKPLVILDTLGKVKPNKLPGEESYLVDYKIGSRLKALADAVPGSTLLVVHHHPQGRGRRLRGHGQRHPGHRGLGGLRAGAHPQAPREQGHPGGHRTRHPGGRVRAGGR